MGIVMIMRIVLIVWMAHAMAYGSAARQKLTACLRVNAVERRLISPQAQELAARMFADVGISLEWRACEPAGESSQAPIVVELASGTPQDFKFGVLGYAMPHQGRRVTVFLDRIETMERPEPVLAHVIVHEITHIVQGVCRHSDTGLMKAHWTVRDLFEMRYKPLPFTEEDLMLLYRGLGRDLTGTPLVER
jgi:hypothetical protein